MPVRNYTFTAKSPTLNAEMVDAQMQAAHRYRNKLCELELTKRAAAEATVRRLSPEYAAAAEIVDQAEARVDAAYESIKAASRKARRRVPATPEQEQELADAKANRSDAIAAAKELKALAYEELKRLQAPYLEQAKRTVSERGEKLTPTAEKRAVRDEYLRLLVDAGIDAGQAAHERDTKLARANCGCFWCTYLTVEDAASKFHVGTPPRFAAWTGDGTIAVQLQGGLSVDDAMSRKDTRLQLHVPNQEELSVKGWSRGLRARGSVKMRIDSDGRAPVWTECPVVWHRPLPTNGVIKWAYLHRRIRGAKTEWQLRLAVEFESTEQQSPSAGVCAVHPGHRLIKGDIRVATLAATSFPPALLSDPELSRHLVRQGDVVEVMLPHDHIFRREKANSISAYRDDLMNRRAPRLVKWLANHADILPEWLRAKCEHIGKWQSQQRFVDLCDKWYANRFAGDELAFGLFHRWRRRDIHLHDYEFNLVRKSSAWRDQLYRVLSRRLSEHYAAVILPKIDWKSLRQKNAPDEEITQVNRQRMIAGIASPGMLGEKIAEKCAGRLITVPGSKITMACATCGQEDKWNRANRYHHCSKCGDQYDQDHNAARNELARGLAAIKSREPLADQEDKGLAVENDDSNDGVATGKKATSRKSRRNRRYSQIVESQR